MREVAESLYNAALGAVGIAQGVANMIATSLLLGIVAIQFFRSALSKGSDLGIDMMPIYRGIIILFILQTYSFFGNMLVNMVKAVGEVDIEKGSISAQFQKTHEERLASAQIKFINALYEQGKGYFNNVFASNRPISALVYGFNDYFSADKLNKKANFSYEELRALENKITREKNIRQREQQWEQELLAREAAAEQGGWGDKISYYFNLVLDKISGVFSFTAIAVNWIKEGITILIRNVVVIVSLALLGFAYAVGPIPIALSIVPVFKDAYQRWLSSMISFGLWGLTIKILDTMSMGLAEYTFVNGMDDTNPVRYITINIVMIVMYLATPRLSNLMLGSGGEFYSAMTALAGGMAMSKFNQASSFITRTTAGTVGTATTFAGQTMGNILGNTARGAWQGAYSMGADTARTMGQSASQQGASSLAGRILGAPLGGTMGLGLGALQGLGTGVLQSIKSLIPKHR